MRKSTPAIKVQNMMINNTTNIMNTKKYVAIAAVFGVLVSIVIPSISLVTAGGVGSCTLASKSGRTIVNFNERIYSDRGQVSAEAGPVGVSLPAGEYKVTLVSYDNHSDKPTQYQPDESWFVILRDKNAHTVTTSNSINDLPSHIETLTQVVNSNLDVSSDIESVVAMHAAYPDLGNANSIEAVCAAFDLIDTHEEEPGDKPDVTTLSPTGVDDESATLRGEVDPNGEDTDAWFEWGTNSSNLTHDTSWQDVGSGSSDIDFSDTIYGLDEDTTYYYRAVAENDNGKDFGNVKSFTTGEGEEESDKPDVTTLSATDIEDNEARLRGEVYPNGEDTDVWFEWGTSRYNLNRETSSEEIDSDTTVSTFSEVIDDLEEGEKYYFRAVAENSEGKDYGSVLSFTTDENGGGDDGPEIKDVDVDDIDDDRATLVCKVDANGEDTDVWFEWGEDDNDLDEETRTVEVDRDETNQTVRISITGLDEDTRYYFRCFADNRDGDDKSGIEDFRTDDNGGSRSDDEPNVTTLSATDIDNTSAVLRGEVDPNGEDTDAWFEWGTSSSNLNRDTSSEDVGDGNSDVDFDRRISGLNTNTTYYFRAVAESREGIDRGSVRSFRTGGTTILPPIREVITRIIEVVREEKVEEALIVTLESDKEDAKDTGEIQYTVTYDNRTDETFTNAVLVIELPNELDFVDANPREDSKRGDEITFEIGTISPGEEDSFVIDTEVGRNVDENENIVFTANLDYTDGNTKKLITVIDDGNLGGAKTSGGFAAFIFGSLKDFFTNPFLWLLVLLILIFLAYRYFAVLARPDREEVIYEAPRPVSPPRPVQQPLAGQ